MPARAARFEVDAHVLHRVHGYEVDPNKHGADVTSYPLSLAYLILYSDCNQGIQSTAAQKGDPMGNGKASRARIDRRLEGESIQVGDRIVQPVGRVTGRQINAGGGHGGFSGVKAQLHPLEIIVREGEEEHTIPIEDPQQEPLRGILMAGIAVCVGCILIMLMAHRMAKSKMKS